MRKFMRTRTASSRTPSPHSLTGHTHKTNGHANGGTSGAAGGGGGGGGGGGTGLDERHSTLSRCWSGSEWPADLYEDKEFDANWRALGERRLARGVRWCRPQELCARPRFRGDEVDLLSTGHGASEHGAPDDAPDPAVDRWTGSLGGELASGAVCVAAAALAATPRLLDRAVPPQDCWPHRAYTGAFRFRFWVWGSWREVVVDDRLPVRGHAPAVQDFTLPLLHKAYAKLYGAYSAARGAGLARALQELSGAVVQSVPLPQPRVHHLLQAALPRATLLLCAPPTDELGLRRHQPCAVTGLARVRGVTLLRLRAHSPAAALAWAGAWSPPSAEWRALSAAERAALALPPGHLWMCADDWQRLFSRVELLHVSPDDWLHEPALSARRPWRAVLARRRWRTGYNAGGPPHHAETTGTNPQFFVQIPQSGAEAGKCHVVVSVTQQYAPARRGPLHAVGFALYEAPAEWGGPGPGSLRALRPLDVTHESRAREVVTFFTLPPGRYLLVPHTGRAHTDAAFLLRVLTDLPADVWERNHDNVLVRDLPAELRRDPGAVPPAARAAAARACPPAAELDARALRGALQRAGCGRAAARPSLELCRALLALCDAQLTGSVPARELPALVALLWCWRGLFARHGGARGCSRAGSSYELRALLWAAGVTASNKVLEALVLRFARGARLSLEGYVMALARLHLAHERYRSLDNNTKSNPLSLEEMILMTIYS